MRNGIAAARLLVAWLIVVLPGRGAIGQAAQQEPLLTARHMSANASVKVFNPAGAVRLVGWNRDSLEVHGRVSPRKRYYASGDSNGVKLGVEEAGTSESPAHGDITIRLPRLARVAVKTVNGDIDATDVAGWFYTIAGAVRLDGTASSIEVESMRGDVELRVAAPWLRARAGAGRVLLRGATPDVDVSTISGALEVAGSAIMRGQFTSVSGDIAFAGAPAAGAILDFSNHSGAVDFVWPRSVAGTFALSTVTGTIVNGFTALRPVSQAERSVKFSIGRGGADVTVRTFKGTIRVRPE